MDEDFDARGTLVSSQTLGKRSGLFDFNRIGHTLQIVVQGLEGGGLFTQGIMGKGQAEMNQWDVILQPGGLVIGDDRLLVAMSFALARVVRIRSRRIRAVTMFRNSALR